MRNWLQGNKPLVALTGCRHNVSRLSCNARIAGCGFGSSAGSSDILIIYGSLKPHERNPGKMTSAARKVIRRSQVHRHSAAPIRALTLIGAEIHRAAPFRPATGALGGLVRSSRNTPSNTPCARRPMTVDGCGSMEIWSSIIGWARHRRSGVTTCLQLSPR